MSLSSLESIWPILAILAAQQRHAIDQYNHIRASRVLRLKYLESLKHRRDTY